MTDGVTDRMINGVNERMTDGVTDRMTDKRTDKVIPTHHLLIEGKTMTTDD